jgi:hypothetical protein
VRAPSSGETVTSLHDMWRDAIAASVVSFAVLVAAAPVGEAAGARKPSPKCPPTHWPVVIADAQAELHIHPALVVEPFTPEEIYDCTYGRKRSYDLGPAPGECGGGGADARV